MGADVIVIGRWCPNQTLSGYAEKWSKVHTEFRQSKTQGRINHKQHPGEFEGASVAYAGRFNFRFYYEKMLNSETGKCGL